MSSQGYNSSPRTSIAPGAFYRVQASDFGSIQLALPSIPANDTADYFVVVPNSASLWRTDKTVQFARPSGTTEALGISIGGVDVVAPLWAASTTFALNSFIVLNSVCFKATVNNGETGTSVPTAMQQGGAGQVKGANTVDNAQTWTSMGRAILIRIHFANSGAAAGSPPVEGSATPVAQEYDFFSL